MENLYGTEEATLQLLSRALAHTDPQRLYLAAVDIFDRSSKEGLVEQCFKAMCRKFSDSPEVGARLLGGCFLGGCFWVAARCWWWQRGQDACCAGQCWRVGWRCGTWDVPHMHLCGKIRQPS